ncbi:rRNA large subunit methyltransferase I [Geothermobacter hydrogeniphilus]|uniref:rRNA large subunit methyltransferase I n=1 Tax=Geothermobacter hydrogeniphilus TaxID=1969733 RepID=A0A2K2HC59_9BACT|nr:class I SAM-dependent rRNA methyltransferase [Geothermobacter hydrogeniphilus]PNU20831.1 rRNA large subunit methyltransferase I [Geothermobacter hydrogeniphilus]
MKTLILHRGHDRRARSGHPWIFSNEIARFEGAPEPGEAVEVLSARGEFIGVAYYNPRPLIAARLVTRQRESIDETDFFRRKLLAATDYRQKIYGDLPALRLVHGEGDGLPGLVVDRYGDVLAIQLLTLGMERRKSLILEALLDIFSPRAIVARNDVTVRELEGLDRMVELLHGELPQELIINEHGLRFKIDLMEGQKTGHFFDQKENHQALRSRVEGRRVLDLFCYSGGWSVHAARFGAREVLGIDISAGAIALSEANARLNYQDNVCRFERADVFELLREMGREGRRFGTIVLDPPAFVKSKKRLPEAIRGYLTINRRSLELIEPGGYLFTCSCSYHLKRDIFLDTLRKAATQAGRTVRLLEMRGQAYDHPVLLSCPETEYLKCAVLQVL